MKIPESVRIAGVEYPVKVMEFVHDDSRLCYGQVFYSGCRIEISTNGTSHEHRCVTLWHEIVHTIIDNAEFEVPEDKEETFVTILSRGIYQVLQDNGGRLFDLASEKGLKTENVTDIEQDLLVERAQSAQYKKQLGAAETLLHTVNELSAGVAGREVSGDEAVRKSLLVCKLIDEYFEKERKDE